MAKGKKSIYFCQNCGHEEAKWLGQCPMCKEWNTFVEERVDSGITKGTTVAARAVQEAKVIPLTEVSADDDTRNQTGIKELDRVLGGGIVPVKFPTTAISEALKSCSKMAVAATGRANSGSLFQMEPCNISNGFRFLFSIIFLNPLIYILSVKSIIFFN